MMRPSLKAIARIAETRWLRLESLQYTDARGADRTWDRVTRNGSTGIDAVAIFPVLKEGNSIDTLLVKQYRPPLDAYTIELPAGLIDEGETPQEAAVRELLEETGYVGRVEDCEITGSLPLSPGLSDETVALVAVAIDMSLACNQNPQQDLDESEDIELMRVKLESLKGTLDELQDDGECHVFLGLHCIAMGIELGKKMT
jgi:8-oxo-dGTP pyrophosphatase MutT (NUDIX family)